MHTMSRTVVMGAALWLTSTAAAGQTVGALRGQVTDQTGGAMPGVAISLRSAESELSGSTNDSGTYEFTDVPAGPAEVTFTLINFAVVHREVAIQPEQTTTADVVMALSLTADVVVTGARSFRNIADLEDPTQNLVGIATAASQGAITAAQLEARPIMRPAEVLESVPGLIASQHSGEGKANQYYLRGFNLDHGSDFATTLAGVPINVPSSAHSHGYSDTNLLIPELVSGVQFMKGPYSAENGDFAAAGAANISYVNRLERPFVSAGGGGQGWGRILAAASPRVGSGYLFGALELGRNDGPWDRPDDLGKVNALLRFSQGDSRNGFSMTGIGYVADWNSTDQIPARAVDNGLISRFGNIDSSDGGKTHRYSVSVDAQRSSSNTSTRATAFVMRYGLNLFSNFTYFLDDPEDGDQFEQADRRWTTGARVTHRRLGNVFGQPAEHALGGQVRHDAVGEIGLFRTIARQRTSAVRDDTLDQTTFAVYGHSEIEWSRAFRTTLGLRADMYQFNVNSGNPLNSGDGVDGIVSPKFTAVLGPWANTEYYVNAGLGFHSNDARGATITVDPMTGEPAATVTPLVQARGGEFGVRTVRIRGLQSTLALWYLGFDSELLFIGDAGITEASRPSRRLGVEWANYLRFNSWLTGEIDISFSRARFTDSDPAGDFIPGSLDRVVSGGLTMEPYRRIFGSILLRHFGPRPLVEDASVTSESTTIWNGEVGYHVSDRARLTLEVFNLFDSDVSDIDYFYASRLPGEAAEGIDDVHFHPSLPRTARLALRVFF